MFGFLKPGRRTTSEPALVVPDLDELDNGRHPPSSTSSATGKQSLENKSVQELEDYAVHKSEEVTKDVNNCLRIAEDIRQDASRTLDMLHQQGEQIERTHHMAVDMDKDLSKGEKLLGNLGGMFSKPWKPKKTKDINGPVITADKSYNKNKQKQEQKEKLGIIPPRGAKSAPVTPPPESANAMQKVEHETAKQDDALSDLSNILGDLRGMAVDMGGELDRQNHALDHLSDDVDELNSRVKGANQRARHLLNK